MNFLYTKREVVDKLNEITSSAENIVFEFKRDIDGEHLQIDINDSNAQEDYLIDYISIIHSINEVPFRKRIIVNRKIIANQDDYTLDLNLSNCEFKNQLVLFGKEFKGRVDFNYSVFNEINFSYSIFHEKTTFQHCIFDNLVDFYNTTFNNLVDFYYSTFKCSVQFHLTDFKNITVFSRVTFEQELQFLYNNISTESTKVSFENATFNRCIDISRSNFYCILNFWSSTIKIDSIIEELGESQFYKTDNGKLQSKTEKGNDVYHILRESIRIIKHSFKESNNVIESLRYQKVEIELLSRDRESDKKWSDSLSLQLNRVSNNHGLRWDFGICFTVMVGFVTFFILLDWDLIYRILCTKDFRNPHSDIGKQLIQFYLPFNIEYPSSFLKENLVGFLIFYISKFLIAYGYYQTIAAFRKYLKN
ncbi:hypothetical protein MATR_26880 [Marivirga tractuosa]|uniref:Pentapeptide repeat-containing protein n=1 Tax=Marivirga tractuosa (strain ATCC 23168 / DSM 4126 / NBRC 15989 / NCIMB 1408 / VKM B-1430 / H-43) TaxID=643867 RepID=E4TN72_MARTH|nr:pentapeptide repeat-containing protein [Marivirga tractuosa]ADR23460.1 hypothetical protein Ftrac_3488 [Marivirga tractuosa DSM 4126]BDD15863.1 hypothetical protein MATR_26880 [Marivirga tractuosa]